jgi:hypothetical protein
MTRCGVLEFAGRVGFALFRGLRQVLKLEIFEWFGFETSVKRLRSTER